MQECPLDVDVSGAVSRFERDRAVMWSGLLVGGAVGLTGLIVALTADGDRSGAGPVAGCGVTGCLAGVRVRLR